MSVTKTRKVAHVGSWKGSDKGGHQQRLARRRKLVRAPRSTREGGVRLLVQEMTRTES